MNHVPNLNCARLGHVMGNITIARCRHNESSWIIAGTWIDQEQPDTTRLVFDFSADLGPFDGIETLHALAQRALTEVIECMYTDLSPVTPRGT